MPLETMVVFILVLGVLVVFHEWGHFTVAKLTGIRVEEFAVGFGPVLAKLFKRGDTEYNIRAFPLGGFVKLTGMEPGEEDIPDGFQAQALWKRALVIFAGPLFSFILAVLVFQFIGLVWGFQDTSKTLNKVLQVNPNTVASSIGLRAGDEILSVNGAKIRDGAQMVDMIHRSPGKPVVLVVKHDGQVSKRTALPSWNFLYAGASWSFMKGDQAVVEGVEEKSEAARAGIQTDDKLVSINGQRIVGGAAMASAIRANDSKTASLELMRGDKVVTVSMTPTVQWVDFAGAKWYFPEARAYEITRKHPSPKIKLGDKLLSIGGEKIQTGKQALAAVHSGKDVSIEISREGSPEPIALTLAPGKVESSVYEANGLLGFTPQFAFTKMGFTKSVKAGWERTVGLVKLILTSLSPKRIGQSVGGPVMIVKQTSSMVALGPYYVVQMCGMLSMSLAIINLVPIPAILDGGHLLLLGIEGLRKKRWSRAQMQTMQVVGLAMIAVIFVLVMVSDVTKIIGGQVPQ